VEDEHSIDYHALLISMCMSISKLAKTTSTQVTFLLIKLSWPETVEILESDDIKSIKNSYLTSVLYLF
jgi:hypothetical protein